MKQEIYELPEPLTDKEMNDFIETNEKIWGKIDEVCQGKIDEVCQKYKCSIILEWKEKADKYDEIMEKRKKASEKSKASLMKNMTAEERKARSLKAIQARWGKKNTTNS